MDIRTLPIGPEEAFILSRVDGRATAAEIASSTGLETPRVSELLKRLATLGALTLEGHETDIALQVLESNASAVARRALEPSGAGAAASTRVRISSPIVETLASRPRRTPGPKPLYDPSELDEPSDLPDERKKWLLDLYYLLPRMDHYTLLGVPRSAQKKDIKDAYFRLVSVLHPDRYFGKQLGHFKSKLEKCFQRATDAHDTLTRKKARTDYDHYLESRRATRELDHLEDVAAVDEQIETLQREIEAEAQQRMIEPTLPPPASSVATTAPAPAPPEPRSSAESIAPSRPSSGTPSAPSRPSSAAFSAPFTPQPVARPSLTDEQRRRALARKLRTTTPMPVRASLTPPARSLQERREAAGEALRNRYESRLRDVIEQRLQRYLDQADEAERSNNVVSAANALRIAVQLSPDSTLLRERFERLERQANEFLAEKYLEQAKYEEQNGDLVEAGRTYEKAARGRPIAPLFEKAALCHMAGKGDLRHASELAKKAVDLAPRDVGYRMTLATLYAKAGMEQSALAELERAKTLEPSNDSIKELVRRIKRGEL